MKKYLLILFIAASVGALHARTPTIDPTDFPSANNEYPQKSWLSPLLSTAITKSKSNTLLLSQVQKCSIVDCAQKCRDPDVCVSNGGARLNCEAAYK
ncbi:MAG: hypothetical protein KA969_14640, partial [Alicycliphilus sp.]|nr:hypothetical protein [Alicycliphilus sp.]